MSTTTVAIRRCAFCEVELPTGQPPDPFSPYRGGDLIWTAHYDPTNREEPVCFECYITPWSEAYGAEEWGNMQRDGMLPERLVGC